MNSFKEQLITIVERILPVFVLSVLLFYTYVRFSEHPYLGFRLGTEGRIIQIFVDDNQAQSLKLGDILIQINNLRWDEFRANLRQPLYNGGKPGQILNLKVMRDQVLRDISWTIPNQDPWEVFHLAFNQVWLAYIFWLAGLLTLSNMRPKDERWWLMMAFNYVTAIWIVAGGDVSFYHLRDGAIVLRMAVWFCIPIYWQLNWFFPKPLSKKLPRLVIWGGYILAVAFALAEWFQKLPPNSYSLGFLLAIGGSLILLLVHAWRQPETRSDLRLLTIAVTLSFLPPVIFELMSSFGAGAQFYGGAAILSLPLLPFGYLYASYRRLLGDVEMRVNRLVSVWIFLILISLILFPLITWARTWINLSETVLFAGIVVIFSTTVASIYFFAPFQTFVEKRLMGILLAPTQLQETYAARITSSTSSLGLHQLIKDELLPSLLVREFTFLQLGDHNVPKLLFAVGVAEDQHPCNADMTALIATAGKYRPLAHLTVDEPCPWVRLVLPLKVEDRLTGLWLFGRRDPDDLYPQIDIPRLQSLADQTAIAQSNILHAERLKVLYLANIDRHEEERLRLALELHDSVLNQIAVLKVSLPLPLPPGFQENYQTLTGQVREIVSNLRPPMLSYGLRPAIEGLVDTLAERAKDMDIRLEIEPCDIRYHPNIEQHLFRIIQEACENAIRHAKAKMITVRGQLDIGKINLIVQDNGVGFQNEEGFSLETLLSEKHFGLTGMMERAELISAKFNIQSAPGEGTQVQIVWADQTGNID